MMHDSHHAITLLDTDKYFNHECYCVQAIKKYTYIMYEL